MLYLHEIFTEASPKAISRRTSYLRVRLEFLPYPQVMPTLFNGCGFDPPRDFTPASICSWVDHPVSGLYKLTCRPIKTWFPFGSGPEVLNLARLHNSPDRSTKSTRLTFRRIGLPLFVNTGFQVLFHSPARGPFHLSFTVLLHYRSLSSI